MRMHAWQSRSDVDRDYRFRRRGFHSAAEWRHRSYRNFDRRSATRPHCGQLGRSFDGTAMDEWHADEQRFGSANGLHGVDRRVELWRDREPGRYATTEAAGDLHDSPDASHNDSKGD